MAEENRNAVTAETAAETDKNKTEEKPQAPPPSLAEDFLRLEQINLLRAVILRMQGGRHPSREIEGLLQRRMNFSREELQGPYVVRLICTIMMVFVAATVFWALLWAFSSILQLSYFLRLISTGIATLFAAVAGIAIFHPSSIPDEKALIDAIEARMNELRRELGDNSQQATDQAKTNDKNPVSDRSVDAKNNTTAKASQNVPAKETKTESTDTKTEEKVEQPVTETDIDKQAETTANEDKQS